MSRRGLLAAAPRALGNRLVRLLEGIPETPGGESREAEITKAICGRIRGLGSTVPIYLAIHRAPNWFGEVCPAPGSQVFVGGPNAVVDALSVAARDLAAENAEDILLVAVDGLRPAVREPRHTRRSDSGPQDPPMSEGAAALWLGRPSDPRPGPRIGFTATSGAPGEAWSSLVMRSLTEAGITARQIQQVLSATCVPAQTEAEDVRDLFTERAQHTLRLAWRCGNAGAPLAAFGIISAIEEFCPTLLIIADHAGRTSLAVSPGDRPIVR